MGLPGGTTRCERLTPASPAAQRFRVVSALTPQSPNGTLPLLWARPDRGSEAVSTRRLVLEVRSEEASAVKQLFVIVSLGLVAHTGLFGCSSAPEDDTGTPIPTPEPSVTPIPGPTPTPDPLHPDWPSVVADLMTFWASSNLDLESGGYFTGVDRTGAITSRDKWTRCVSREVYGFSKAYQMTGDLDWLDDARLGVDWLLTHALDATNGGFYQRLDETGGTVVSDERDMFDLAYALTGLAAYYEVTHDVEVGAVLSDTYNLLDARGWDPEWGGYYKSLTTDMTGVLDDGKDFNALVDPATAFLFTLYAATAQYGDDSSRAAAYAERLRQIGFLIAGNLIDPDGKGWIGENFTREWDYDPEGGQFGDQTICGHNFKAVWALVRMHVITGESVFLTEALNLLEFVRDTCLDGDRGGVYDMVDRATGQLVYGDQKAWWQQEQGMLALQLLSAVAGKSYYDRLSLETRAFYLEWFPDSAYGEVFATLEGDGTVKDPTKGNEWKSAYHSVETAYFTYLYDAFLETLTPVTLYYYFEPADEDRAVRLAPVALPYGSFSVQDPVLLDGNAVTLQTPTQVVIPAGTGGRLEVVYLPAEE